MIARVRWKKRTTKRATAPGTEKCVHPPFDDGAMRSTARLGGISRRRGHLVEENNASRSPKDNPKRAQRAQGRQALDLALPTPSVSAGPAGTSTPSTDVPPRLWHAAWGLPSPAPTPTAAPSGCTGASSVAGRVLPGGHDAPHLGNHPPPSLVSDHAGLHPPLSPHAGARSGCLPLQAGGAPPAGALRHGPGCSRTRTAPSAAGQGPPLRQLRCLLTTARTLRPSGLRIAWPHGLASQLPGRCGCAAL
jgi:hypothetical protein